MYSEALELYSNFESPPTETDLFKLSKLVTPWIRKLSFRYEADELARDGIINQALAVVLKRALEGAFPPDPEVFGPYLKKTVVRALRDAARDQLPFSLPEGGSIPPDAPGASGQLDPDLAEAIRKLPDYVGQLVLSRNRHPELTPGLLKYIVCSLLTDQVISSKVLEKYGGLQNVGYYVGYISVLVRWALYEIRDTLREADGSTAT